MDTLQTTIPNNPQASPPSEDEQDKIFGWTEAKIHLKRLADEWREEAGDTEVRRKTRKVMINVEELRQEGKLDEDESIIPVRVIDTNIQREQPSYINYLKNSRRIAVFKSLDEVSLDTDLLERDFTRGMTYIGWETPHFKCLDGSQTHGWDSVEVVYDPSKPLNCGIEHIGHDKLIFPRSAIDLQQCPRIMRIYDVTMLQLRKWVKSYSFSQEQVDLILAKRRDTRKENETIRIYKVYFKKTHPDTNKSCVYVSWCTFNEGETDWLKQPVQHSVGIKQQIQKLQSQQAGIDPVTGQPIIQQVPVLMWQDVPLETYPIYILPYRETEEDKIADHKGRVYYDENKQEAQTAILSAFVNGLTRASNIYGSPGIEDGSGSSLRELEDVKLTGGRILNKPVQFWHPDYPDPMVLRALQYFDVSNSEETNQVNFASLNREDSRKTAKEIGAAQQQQQLLNSVQLTLFSTFIRQVYSFVWLVVQSQALQNNIKFLIVAKQKPQINPVTQQPIINTQTGQPSTESYFENDFQTLSQTFDVRAAGDVDVIQKEEMIQKMQQDWPVVMNTPLKDQFLSDYIKLKYPEDAEKYIPILQQSSQIQTMQSLIARLGTVLNGAIKQNPQMLATLPEQDRASVSQMMQEAQGFMGQSGQQ